MVTSRHVGYWWETEYTFTHKIIYKVWYGFNVENYKEVFSMEKIKQCEIF